MFSSSKLEHSVWRLVGPPLVAGLLLSAAYQSGAQAAAGPAPIYVISDHEGYGVVECLTKRRECGKIVADSWCEAHGHGPAKAFGPADDITASVGPASPQLINKPGAAIVTCEE